MAIYNTDCGHCLRGGVACGRPHPPMPERVEFSDPFNARDYAMSLNLLGALYRWAEPLKRGHSQICDCNLCKTLKATDDFLNHRTVE